jgi:hypothetical protein
MGIRNWIIKRKVKKFMKESRMGKFLEGKKTYLVMAATMILAGVDQYNSGCVGEACVVIPKWVYAVLGGMGIATRKVAKPK